MIEAELCYHECLLSFQSGCPVLGGGSPEEYLWSPIHWKWTLEAVRIWSEANGSKPVLWILSSSDTSQSAHCCISLTLFLFACVRSWDKPIQRCGADFYNLVFASFSHADIDLANSDFSLRTRFTSKSGFSKAELIYLKEIIKNN